MAKSYYLVFLNKNKKTYTTVKEQIGALEELLKKQDPTLEVTINKPLIESSLFDLILQINGQPAALLFKSQRKQIAYLVQEGIIGV